MLKASPQRVPGVVLTACAVALRQGFTSQSFPYFRDELGNPRTPRDSNGNIASSQTKTFSCNSNTYNEIVPSTSAWRLVGVACGSCLRSRCVCRCRHCGVLC